MLHHTLSKSRDCFSCRIFKPSLGDTGRPWKLDTQKDPLANPTLGMNAGDVEERTRPPAPNRTQDLPAVRRLHYRLRHAIINITICIEWNCYLLNCNGIESPYLTVAHNTVLPVELSLRTQCDVIRVSEGQEVQTMSCVASWRAV